MESESKKNSRSRHCSQVLGSHMFGKICVITEAVLQSTSLPHTKKYERGTGFCGNFGVLVNIYTPFSTMPLSLIPFSQKEIHMGLGNRVAFHLQENKKYWLNRSKPLDQISYMGLPLELDILVAPRRHGIGTMAKAEKNITSTWTAFS